MFGSLTVTKIFSKNFDSTVAFYRDTLRMKVMEVHPAAVVFDTGNGDELIVANQQDNGRAIGIAFTDVDIPAAHQNLAAAGVEVTDIQPHKTGERFEITDPEGNRIIFVNA